MKRLVIYVDAASEGATLIADEMGCKKVKPDGTYVPKANDIILNWGCSTKPNWGDNLNGAKVLNKWDKIAVGADKKRTFEALKPAGVSIPEFSTNVADARSWVQGGGVAVGRQILNGSEGNGIVICETLDQVNAAQGVKLWTKYFNASSEYRVFVVRNPQTGQAIVFDGVQKKRKAKADRGADYSPKIRSHSRGWIFAREGVVLPQVVQEEAKKTLLALGMDIGAVDIRYSDTGVAKVLEINSRFGISDESTTLVKVTDALESILNNDAPEAIPVPPPAPAPVQPAPVKTNTVTPQASTPKPAGKIKKHCLKDLGDVEIEEEGDKVRVYAKLGNRRVIFLEVTGRVDKALSDLFA